MLFSGTSIGAKAISRTKAAVALTLLQNNTKATFWVEVSKQEMVTLSLPQDHTE